MIKPYQICFQNFNARQHAGLGVLADRHLAEADIPENVCLIGYNQPSRIGAQPFEQNYLEIVVPRESFDCYMSQVLDAGLDTAARLAVPVVIIREDDTTQNASDKDHLPAATRAFARTLRV